MLNPLIQILDQDIKEHGPNTDPWGTPVVTGHQLDITPVNNTVSHVIQANFNPVSSGPIQDMNAPILQENAVKNVEKGFINVPADNVQSLSFIC